MVMSTSPNPTLATEVSEANEDKKLTDELERNAVLKMVAVFREVEERAANGNETCIDILDKARSGLLTAKIRQNIDSSRVLERGVNG